MQRLLEEVQFHGASRAAQNTSRLGQALAPEVQSRLRSLLAATADPDAALHLLERLRQDQPEPFGRWMASAAGLRVLVAVFSFNRFLAETVLAHPGWVDRLLAPGELHRVRSAEEYAEQLESFLVPQPRETPRLSCHRFRGNQVRLWLSVIAYKLANLWPRLVPPLRAGNRSLTGLRQRLVKTGGRLVKHARCYWLLLAEGHLTRRLFGAMVRRIEALPAPDG